MIRWLPPVPCEPRSAIVFFPAPSVPNGPGGAVMGDMFPPANPDPKDSNA